VCTHLDRQHDALVSLFTRRLIVSHLDLGALMEISDERCPTVTIEVGGRLDEEAHELAWEGCSATPRHRGCWPRMRTTTSAWRCLADPIRLELQDGVTLSYGEAPRPGHDITLRADIEHHNFGVVRRAPRLGWLQGDPQALFRAVDASGRCAVAALVRVENGELYPARDLKLFMITTNASIAETDCLFYAVADTGAAIAIQH
jgi:hypothetical protein